jgi:hypothetical protein
MPGDTPSLDDGRATILRLVQGHDWMVMRVDDEGEELAWSYTIGLWQRLGHPEVIAFGLPAKTAQDILNLVGEQIRDDGVRFVDGEVSERLAVGFPMKFTLTDPRRVWDYTQGARWYYLDHLGANENAPFLQCIWPDSTGKFPGEFGWRETPGWPQPVLKRRLFGMG